MTKILIVGNGAIKGHHGPLIDNPNEFDRVIRINQFQTLSHTQKVGTRISIVSTRANNCFEQFRQAPMMWFVGSISSRRYWNTKDGKEKDSAWAKRFRRVFIQRGAPLGDIPRVFWEDRSPEYRERVEELKKWCSLPEDKIFTTGILTIAAVQATWAKARPILLGFDGCKTGHYFNTKHKHMDCHDPETEQKLLKALARSEVEMLE